MNEDKYCGYCKKVGHWLSECWCTRPVDWKESNIPVEISSILTLTQPQTFTEQVKLALEELERQFERDDERRYISQELLNKTYRI